MKPQPRARFRVTVISGLEEYSCMRAGFSAADVSTD